MAELDGAPVDLARLAPLALTNYGHFTSMLVEDHAVRGLSLHLARLTRDCRRLFDVDLDADRVLAHVRHALGDRRDPVVVRVTVFDPDLDLGSIGRDARPAVLVSTRPATTSPARPLRLRTVEYQRDLPDVKHVGLFGALGLRRAALRDGFDDVLFRDPDGSVSELATSNVGFLAGDGIVWPAAACLPGVTMSLLDRIGVAPASARAVTVADLPRFDAAFATNAATGIRPIAAVDGVQLPGDTPLLTELRRRYADLPGEPL